MFLLLNIWDYWGYDSSSTSSSTVSGSGGGDAFRMKDWSAVKMDVGYNHGCLRRKDFSFGVEVRSTGGLVLL